MTPTSARRKAAGMVKLVRDHLGWAVKWPSNLKDPASPPRYMFSFEIRRAREEREYLIQQITQQLLQEG